MKTTQFVAFRINYLYTNNIFQHIYIVNIIVNLFSEFFTFSETQYKKSHQKINSYKQKSVLGQSRLVTNISHSSFMHSTNN